METLLDGIKYILVIALKLVLFVLLSIIFLPSFFVVSYLQDTWSKMLSELFSID